MNILSFLYCIAVPLPEDFVILFFLGALARPSFECYLCLCACFLVSSLLVWLEHLAKKGYKTGILLSEFFMVNFYVSYSNMEVFLGTELRAMT